MARRNTGREVLLEPAEGDELVIGFDVSSTTIGWGLLSGFSSPRLVGYGHYRPPTSKHPLIDRLSAAHEHALGLCERFGPIVAAVEEIALFIGGKRCPACKQPRGGASSARTITTLAFFNGAVALAAHKAAGCVKFYPVSTIRKLIKEASGVRSTPRKNDIPDLVRNHLNAGFTDVPKARGIGPAAQTYDEADGIAVAWACSREMGK